MGLQIVKRIRISDPKIQWSGRPPVADPLSAAYAMVGAHKGNPQSCTAGSRPPVCSIASLLKYRLFDW